MSIMILEPYYVQKIWGGSLLSKIKKLKLSGLPLGESLEISRLKGNSSKLNGEELKEVLSVIELPYLTKLIDTSDFLSVQVHPDNQYALKNETSTGKSECWVILEANKGDGIYLGFKHGTDASEFKAAVDNQDDLTRFLKFYEVQRGDFFYVPAGTVHAIGKGVFLAEVQQSSRVTYRVWDWNRVDENGNGRKLHIEKAMDVLNFDDEFNTTENFKFKRDVLSADFKLLDHKSFSLYSHILNPGDKLELPKSDGLRKRSIMCLKGRLAFEEGNSILEQYCSGILITNEKVTISTNELSQFLVIR